jgi:2,4-dienoyl-CoA reductase-like NADH-dependent reductase (Old Yellow Enzyme family)
LAHLLEPLTIRSVTLRNRICVSPMCMYSSENGHATDWHFVHLGSRAVGGAALVIAEATAVEARGRISPEDAGLWTDSQIAPLTRITQFIAKHGAIPGIQLAHAGRKASTVRPWEKEDRPAVPPDKGGWEPVAPSPVPFDKDYPIPRELMIDEIKGIQQKFLEATERSLKAGYRWLELHAAHGYLCHSFQSPISNKRTDQYGGCFENRIRFTLETAKAMREFWPQDLPMSVRLSCTDWYEGGWTLAESVELAKKLKEVSVDLIDCSSGAGTPLAKMKIGANYQVPFANAVKHEAGIMTGAVGMVTEPMQADAIIRNEHADIVFLARELLRDPYWPVHAARSLHQADKLRLPDPYHYAAYPKV